MQLHNLQEINYLKQKKNKQVFISFETLMKYVKFKLLKIIKSNPIICSNLF